MSRIQPLSADAISQIHSSKNITSLQDVILALLENSLDAASSKIEVTVDFRRGGCTVEDNGHGIPSAEFREDGGLCKMYHTSKRLASFDRKHELHGSTGTYLASLAALSLLCIASKHSKDLEEATVTMHQGKCISRHSSNHASEHKIRTTTGTLITVRDLFGNMPVRVKQRALTADTSHHDEKTWLQLKRGISALLVAWPRPCSVRLIDATRTDRRVCMAASHPNGAAALTRRGLQKLQGGAESGFNVQDTLPILFQAGLALPDSRTAWVPISASAVSLTVKGLICLDPSPTKQCQFVSLGVRPCLAAAGCGDIYDAINKVFTNSSFGAEEDFSDVDDREKDRRKRDRRYKDDGYTQRQLHGRKGIDRWPMFILQVNFRDQRSFQTTQEELSEAKLKIIVDVLEAAVTQWLSAHHFRPRKKTGRRKNLDQQSPAPTLGSEASYSDSSAPESIRNANNAPTGDVPRAASAHSRHPSRKRKIIDLSERPATVGRSNEHNAHQGQSPFGLWSRIKSGKEANRLQNAQKRRAVTAPEGQVDSEDSMTVKAQKAPAFSLPPIEAGSLNLTRRSNGNLDQTEQRDSPSTTVLAAATGSSEDFGNVDEDEMMAVADGAETLTHGAKRESESSEPGVDEVFDWTDSKSKQKYRVNSRTGVVLPARSRSMGQAPPLERGENGLGRQRAAIDTGVSSTGRPLILTKRSASLRPTTSEDKGAVDQWLPGFLQEWNNPVFVHQHEERIPIACPDGPGIDIEDAARHRCGHDFDHEQFGRPGAAAAGQLTKAGLRSAIVIAQVDRKFILCRMSDGGKHHDESLVLVDQHAASERVILEDLFSQLCQPANDSSSPSGVQTTVLEKPLRFQISGKEFDLFRLHRSHFAAWGMLYSLSSRDEHISASQDVRTDGRRTEHHLTLTDLPTVIAERCTLVPRLAIELLRSEVWSVAETSHRSSIRSVSTASDDEQQHTWLHRIGACPKGILDLFYSRACRSAIMFNDVLSLKECEELMQRVSKCAFPFVCAHGRVSMVPVVQLGEVGQQGIGMGQADGGIGGFFGHGEGDGSGGPGAVFGRWLSARQVGETG